VVNFINKNSIPRNPSNPKLEIEPPKDHIQADKEHRLDIEARLIEQDHRIFRVMQNFFFRDQWPKNDPTDNRRKAAAIAVIWKVFAPGNAVIAGAGVLSLLLFLAMQSQNLLIADQLALSKSDYLESRQIAIFNSLYNADSDGNPTSNSRIREEAFLEYLSRLKDLQQQASASKYSPVSLKPHLAGALLNDSRLHDVNIDNFDLSESNFKGTRIIGGHWSDITLDGSSVDGLRTEDVRFGNITANAIKISDVVIEGGTIESLKFGGEDISGMRFSNIQFDEIELDFERIQDLQIHKVNSNKGALSINSEEFKFFITDSEISEVNMVLGRSLRNEDRDSAGFISQTIIHSLNVVPHRSRKRALGADEFPQTNADLQTIFVVADSVIHFTESSYFLNKYFIRDESVKFFKNEIEIPFRPNFNGCVSINNLGVYDVLNSRPIHPVTKLRIMCTILAEHGTNGAPKEVVVYRLQSFENSSRLGLNSPRHPIKRTNDFAKIVANAIDIIAPDDWSADLYVRTVHDLCEFPDRTTPVDESHILYAIATEKINPEYFGLEENDDSVCTIFDSYHPVEQFPF
jgi:hypothetical protein